MFSFYIISNTRQTPLKTVNNNVIFAFQALHAVLKRQNVALMSSGSTVDTTYMEIPVYDVDKPQTLEKRKAR